MQIIIKRRSFMRALFFLLLLSSAQLWADNSQYDKQIQNASAKYLPQWQWQWWKAQLYQESLFNPYAQSPVGASGIAQFMPATCNEVFRQLGWECEPLNADKSIRAGAFYMSRLRRIWRARRSESGRREWAQCSYNYGAGNCINAQARCGNNRSIDNAMSCLPQETRTYINRIKLYFEKFSCD